MWRDAVRWLFVRLRLVRRPDLVSRIIGRHPTPEELPEGKLVMVRDGNRNKMGMSALSRPMWGETSTGLVVEPTPPLVRPSRLARTA